MIRRLSLVLAIVLIGLFLFASCATPPAPAAAPPAPPPAPPSFAVIQAVPNVLEPAAAFEFVGANFPPNERFQVSYMYPPLVEGADAVYSGFYVTTDAIGSFVKADAARSYDLAVSPVVVYDKDGNTVASTLFVVKKPPAK